MRLVSPTRRMHPNGMVNLDDGKRSQVWRDGELIEPDDDGSAPPGTMWRGDGFERARAPYSSSDDEEGFGLLHYSEPPRRGPRAIYADGSSKRSSRRPYRQRRRESACS